MNSYETLSEYYDRFTDDVGYEEWADFFERLFEREGVKPSLVLDLVNRLRGSGAPIARCSEKECRTRTSVHP